MNWISSYISILICVALIAWVGFSLGINALGIVVLLVILEVTLSFDNAVVNAGVLRHMTPIWQRRFLTWGLAVAVFGARAVLPILIVAVGAWVSPFTIGWIALSNPAEYGDLLSAAHFTISAFGGLFLMMVAFKYFFNQEKERHWIHMIEKRLSEWGNIRAIEVLVSLVILLILAASLPMHRMEVLIAGCIGIGLFTAIQAIIGTFSLRGMNGAQAGLALFIYLNILDASFSLDGVVGAFALSNNVVLIGIGLGIGAYFVRRLTLYIVHKGTLDELIYIEHGAHWAILGLSATMLVSMFVYVPQPITGFIGFGFLVLAYISSRRALP